MFLQEHTWNRHSNSAPHTHPNSHIRLGKLIYEEKNPSLKIGVERGRGRDTQRENEVNLKTVIFLSAVEVEEETKLLKSPLRNLLEVLRNELMNE